MKKVKLRDYQEKAVELTREAITNGNNKPLVVLPTGSGKTIVYGKIVSLAVSKGNKCLFLVHRRNLVIQFKESLKKFFGINAGVIMAGSKFETGHDVYVSTIQTYSRRVNLDSIDSNRWFIDADVILTDEAHVSVSVGFKKVLDLYHSKVIIGTTATPQRSDGKGLGEVYNAIIDVAGTGELTRRGFLSPVRYFSAPIPDIDKIKVRLGDYEKKELGEKMNDVKLVGDIVENWLRIAGNRRTIGFAVNVKHSIHIVGEFSKQGIAAEHLDARSTDEERTEVLDRLRSGDTRVVFNVGLFVEGMDIPNISCVIMACPTKSLGKYRQASGRGMRISEKHDDMILLDHGGIVERLGFLTDDIEWSLDGKDVAAKKKPDKKEKKPVKCQSCNEVFQGADKCPSCGSPVKTFGKKIDCDDADLKEVNPKKTNREMSWDMKRRMSGGFAWYCAKNGKSKGYAAHLYKHIFGVWPNDRRVRDVPPIKPSGDVANMVKYAVISKAKAFQKAKTI